jgi:hypothetical protein
VSSVRTGKPLKFTLERPQVTVVWRDSTVQRCLLVFGRWLLPLSRRRVA